MARHRDELTDAQWAKIEPLLPKFKRSKKGGRKPVDIAEALRLHAQGLGVRRIGKRLGVSYGTVHRALRAVTKVPAPNTPK